LISVSKQVAAARSSAGFDTRNLQPPADSILIIGMVSRRASPVAACSGQFVLREINRSMIVTFNSLLTSHHREINTDKRRDARYSGRKRPGFQASFQMLRQVSH
jgi:hypothetical protein